MRKDTVVQLRQPGTFSEDPLTEVLRLGARRLLARAVEMEVTTFVEMHADLTDGAGRRRIVRHGYLPEREIQTGIGPVAVRCPRVRDRGAGEMGPRIRFTSSILPPYLRRAKSDRGTPALALSEGHLHGRFLPRRLRRSLGRRRPGFRPPPLSASRRSGKARWSIGNGAISRPGVTSTSGPTASTSHHGSTTSNASW